MTMREQESISGGFLAGSGCSGRVVYRKACSLRDPAVAFALLPTFEQQTYSWCNCPGFH
jgi:hypothetical protein